MAERRDIAILEVGGQELTRWVSYNIDSDLFIPADAFRLDIDVPVQSTDDVRAATTLGSAVKLYVERAQANGPPRRSLQLTGHIQSRSMSVSTDGGMQLQVQGLDVAGLLTQGGVRPGVICDAHTDTFLTLVRDVVAPYGLEIVADDSAERSIRTGERRTRRRGALERREARAQGVPAGSYSRERLRGAQAAGEPLDEALGVSADSGARFASGIAPSDVQRLTIREARPQTNETAWDYLSRLGRRLGLMLWATTDGKIVVGAPQWDQTPLYRLIRRRTPRPDDPNTILGGGLDETLGNSYSEVRVIGRASSSDSDGLRTRISETTLNPDWPAGAPDRIRYIRDPRIRNVSQAQKRGLAELARGQSDQFKLRYMVDGHGQGDRLYAQGTVAYVDDEPLGIRGNYFVRGRTFKADRDSGTMTELRLIKVRSFSL